MATLKLARRDPNHCRGPLAASPSRNSYLTKQCKQTWERRTKFEGECADVGKSKLSLLQGTSCSVPAKEQLPGKSVHTDQETTSQIWKWVLRVDGEADFGPLGPRLMQRTPWSVPVKEQPHGQSLHADPGVTGQVGGEADVG